MQLWRYIYNKYCYWQVQKQFRTLEYQMFLLPDVSKTYRGSCYHYLFLFLDFPEQEINNTYQCLKLLTRRTTSDLAELTTLRNSAGFYKLMLFHFQAQYNQIVYNSAYYTILSNKLG